MCSLGNIHRLANGYIVEYLTPILIGTPGLFTVPTLSLLSSLILK